MTSNHQLARFMRDNKVSNFCGVYGSDEILNKNFRKDCSIIVNYSPINSKGTHWIAIKNINSNKPIEYFDSYGFRPDYEDRILGVKTNFRKFLDKNGGGKPYIFNKFDLQGYGTDVCGEYATKFIRDGLPYSQDKMKNSQWDRILTNKTTQGRDEEIKKEIKVRGNRPRGYIGGEIDKANAFITNFDPHLKDNLINDESALLSIYYASSPFHQTNTSRKNVELLKKLDINEVGKGLDEINNKNFNDKMIKMDNWTPDRSYRIKQILKSSNPNNYFHKYLISNQDNIGILYNNLLNNPYPYGVYDKFNIDREYNDFFNNYIHHYRKNSYF